MLLRYFGLCQYRVSQVPEVARAAAKPDHRSSFAAYSIRIPPNRTEEKKSRRGRENREAKEKENEKKRCENREMRSRKELWRLHVNCTSSGALVNSIPGTCWSAIHMTVPCYFIFVVALGKKLNTLRTQAREQNTRLVTILACLLARPEPRRTDGRRLTFSSFLLISSHPSNFKKRSATSVQSDQELRKRQLRGMRIIDSFSRINAR